MNFDIIIPVKHDKTVLAVQRTIPAILKFLYFNRLFIISKWDIRFERLSSKHPNKIIILDEDQVCYDLTYKKVASYMKSRLGNSQHTSWYFQQFLKLGIAYRNEISSNYLIWDADAILLKPLRFFNQQGKIYITKTDEHHEPYFRTIESLLGIQKQVSFSFISEHMVFSKKLVLKLLDDITCNSDKIWWKIVLDHVKDYDLVSHGFSEYETYGNYVISKNKSFFELRELVKLRNGKRYLGRIPNPGLLEVFSTVFDYVSIETYHRIIRPMPFRVIMILRLLREVGRKKFSFWSIMRMQCQVLQGRVNV